MNSRFSRETQRQMLLLPIAPICLPFEGTLTFFIKIRSQLTFQMGQKFLFNTRLHKIGVVIVYSLFVQLNEVGRGQLFP